MRRAGHGASALQGAEEDVSVRGSVVPWFRQAVHGGAAVGGLTLPPLTSLLTAPSLAPGPAGPRKTSLSTGGW